MTKTNQKIPNGWSVKRLGEMGKFVSGGTPDTENPEYWNGDIIWLTPSEITKLPTRFVSDSERKITVAGLKNSSAVLLPVGSLIVCTRATVGDCCINTKEVSTNQGFKNLIPGNSNIDFLYYLISSHKTDLIRKACGSTFLEISKHDIEKLKYPVPPLAEQGRIAEILGCWDLGIETLSALIDAKKQRKKGLMQKLLTAKIRLPGYSDKWEKKTLGKITVPVIETVGKKQVVTMSISAKIGFVPQAEKFGKDISGEQYSKYILLPKGAFAYNKGNSKTYPQGCAFRLKNYDEAAVPNVFICFIAKEDCIVPELLEHFFAGNYHGNQLRKVITSSVRDNGLLNLSEDDFYKMELYIPSALSEQKAIADVLSKADEEIDLLTKKLSLLREQKKGLMQQLLTGQIRVKVN